MVYRKVPFSEVKKNWPQGITYELITKQFMQLARDRYPSADKVLQNINVIVGRANITDPIKLAKFKIAILSLFRDSVREFSPSRVYTSIKHRDEIFASIIEALENLEDELEELEEELLEEEMDEDLEEEPEET